MKHTAHGRHSVIGHYHCIFVISTIAPGKDVTNNAPAGVKPLGKKKRDGGGPGRREERQLRTGAEEVGTQSLLYY